ncbi:MAG TPA: hypothetical protein VJN70_10205, partial [Gemmatimonadaceae bacterium]|nr:hypothetical protein [Gemmatimonadaceae bacterium]
NVGWGKKRPPARTALTKGDRSHAMLARGRPFLSYYAAITIDSLNPSLDHPIPCRIPTDTRKR